MLPKRVQIWLATHGWTAYLQSPLGGSLGNAAPSCQAHYRLKLQPQNEVGFFKVATVVRYHLDDREDNKGRTFVKTERTRGVSLDSIEEECWMHLSRLAAHISPGECDAYAHIANANTDGFISNHALP